MSTRIQRLGALALAVTLAACDRTPPTADSHDAGAPATSPASSSAVQRGAMDRLARRLARALADPAFRLYLKGQLDGSPYVEHKLHLQQLLQASDRRVLKDVARLSATPEAVMEADANEAVPLEIYFPVPAHRARWSGGDELLVASAWEDGEPPVA